MKLAYVAGPYSGASHNEVYEHIQAARAVAVELWRMGYAVICPHLNSAFMTGAVDEQAFIDGGIEIMKRSDFVVVVISGDWQKSEGTIAEIREAGKVGIPVYAGIENVPVKVSK